ncbi:MAG: response regulator transcription factor [Lachnospiraceae bacterium]|nr:response regulator transcription factor [Lachnospiraceae bacterium]
MIYILEDDKNIRKLLQYSLSHEGFETKEFSEAKSFYEEASRRVPSLVLLDVMLPGEDGFTVLKKIREDQKLQRLPVIMLTAKTSEIDKLQGLNGGADDYVTKPFRVAELTARIRAVLRRCEDIEGKNRYQYGSMTVDDEKHLVTLEGSPVSLSQKEYGVLRMLLRAKGKVCTREELLAEVWGENYGESRTLDVHIRKLRMKLLSIGDRIETVKGVGYRLAEE